MSGGKDTKYLSGIAKSVNEPSPEFSPSAKLKRLGQMLGVVEPDPVPQPVETESLPVSPSKQIEPQDPAAREKMVRERLRQEIQNRYRLDPITNKPASPEQDAYDWKMQDEPVLKSPEEQAKFRAMEQLKHDQRAKASADQFVAAQKQKMDEDLGELDAVPMGQLDEDALRKKLRERRNPELRPDPQLDAILKRNKPQQ